MPVDHVVKAGDCLLSIADRYGFFPDTLWNHEKNRELKSQRKDPNVLQPGDVVHVPDLTRRDEPRAEKQRHRFRRKGVPGKLKVRLLDDWKPRKNMSYRLVIDGIVTEGKTDGDGYVEQDIHPGASQGELIIDRDDGGTDHYRFVLGSVDPADSEAGVKHRLNDLGYDADDLPRALTGFQHDHALNQTGAVNDETRDKLKEIFGQ
jgi:hypothetical protein